VNGHVFAHQQRASIALRCGDLATAEADAQLALRLAREETGVSGWAPSLAFLIDALVEQGELGRAQLLLDEHEIGDELPATGPWQWVAYSRARLRLRQDRPEDALTDLDWIAAYRAAGGFDPPLNPWRALAAQAAQRLGRTERAQELALADLSAAERWPGPRRLAIALQAVALTDSDPIPALRRALQMIEPSAARLERARVQAALGAALRRSGERRQARELLRQALDGSERCGAAALAEHIRSELEVSGARLRRDRLSGPASLTPAERRTAELAAGGLTNRQIAERLWLSRKTVETQLGAVYLKLGNNDRTALSSLLTPPTDAP
jgi:DNA-binding CsgD family transcriptional regulator